MTLLASIKSYRQYHIGAMKEKENHRRLMRESSRSKVLTQSSTTCSNDAVLSVMHACILTDLVVQSAYSACISNGEILGHSQT